MSKKMTLQGEKIKKNDESPQVQRLMAVINASNRNQLAEFFNINVNAISMWKGVIPPKIAVDVCQKFDICLQWLVNGRGPRRWEEHAPHQPIVTEHLEKYGEIKQQYLLDLWTAADEDARETAHYILEKSARRLREKGAEGPE